MTLCNCKCSCSILSVIVSLIIGIIAAFLQITGAITVTTAFLWVVAGIAVAYLGILLLSASAQQQCTRCSCTCISLNTLLLGILGSIFFAILLLAVGITATSILSAVLVGLLLLFFSLLISSTACLVRHLFDCGN